MPRPLTHQAAARHGRNCACTGTCGTHHAAGRCGTDGAELLAPADFGITPAALADIPRGQLRPWCWPCWRDALRRQQQAFVRTCPACRSTRTQDYGVPIPRTDDYADAARCHACGYAWALDPGANGACATCGGSGIVGGLALWQAPRCPCHEEFSPMAPTGQESRAS